MTYLEGPGEDGAAVLRKHEGGYTRYWLEGGDVRSRDITEAELPLAGFRIGDVGILDVEAAGLGFREEAFDAPATPIEAQCTPGAG